jgi:hypothetical protein
MLVRSRHLKNTCSFGTKGSLIDGMIRIAFDIDDLARLRVRAADETAGHRTVVAERKGLFCALYLVDLFHLIGISGEWDQIDPKGREGQSSDESAGPNQKITTCNFHSIPPFLDPQRYFFNLEATLFSL